MLLRRFDDSSSMSSVSSATTITTSSSMSSSNCGDLTDLLGQIQAKERSGGSPRRKGKDMNHGSKSGVKCSPRKQNVKKADSSMQTDSASAIASSNDGGSNTSNSLHSWKKYLHEHSLKGQQASPTKIAVVSSIQSSDEGKLFEQERSPRAKSAGSKSSNHGYPNGRAVAVIQANPNASGRTGASGRVSERTERTHQHHHHKDSSAKMAQSQIRHYPSEIYSDTECMNLSGGRSYPFCLTSQVLQAANQGSNNNREYVDARERMSNIYGQVCTPWMSRQMGAHPPSQYPAGLPRNALTEAESMESLNSLSALNRTNGLKLSDNPNLGSPMRTSSGLGLMSGRKPRIHAASPVGQRLRKCKENENGEIFSSQISLLSNASAAQVLYYYCLLFASFLHQSQPILKRNNNKMNILP